MKEFHIKIAAAGMMLAALNGCLLDEKSADKVTDEKAGVYVLGYRAQSGDVNSVDYVLTAASLTEGEISAEGRGIEQTGWR